jgi:hypothetical protein
VTARLAEILAEMVSAALKAEATTDTRATVPTQEPVASGESGGAAARHDPGETQQ